MFVFQFPSNDSLYLLSCSLLHFYFYIHNSSADVNMTIVSVKRMIHNYKLISFCHLSHSNYISDT